MKTKIFLPLGIMERALSLLAICLVALGTTHGSAHAATSVSLISISPDATDITSQVPPLPSRMAAFAWQGTAQQQYTIQFSIASEPALVIGIGASISSTSYDSENQVLEVIATYDLPIFPDDRLALPDNTFIIALDPGTSTSGLSSAQTSVRRRARATAAATANTQPCFGPASTPDLYKDTRNDFGEDDGLADPDTTQPDTSSGLPPAAAGSRLSVQSFFWCIFAPTPGSHDVGVKLLGPRGSRGVANLFVSAGYLDSLNAGAGKDVTAKNLAIFSEGLQVSVAVTEVDEGVEAKTSLLFISGSTEVDVSSAQATSAARAKRLAASDDSLVDRSFFLGEREAVSLAPETLEPKGPELEFEGFVADEAFVGQTIEIVREFQSKCKQPATQATSTSGIVIGRDTIDSDGSYDIKVPTSALFPNGAKKSKISSRISGDLVNKSRQISLTNRSRTGRR